MSITEYNFEMNDRIEIKCINILAFLHICVFYFFIQQLKFEFCLIFATACDVKTFGQAQRYFKYYDVN